MPNGGVVIENPLYENQIMKTTENTRLYIISFGDSRKYRLLYNPESGIAESALLPFVKYEKELNEYLSQQFPGDTFAYYTTPRITEVEISHADQYASYPEFNDDVMDDVKKELIREINVMNANRLNNDNAPWADIQK